LNLIESLSPLDGPIIIVTSVLSEEPLFSLPSTSPPNIPAIKPSKVLPLVPTES